MLKLLVGVFFMLIIVAVPVYYYEEKKVNMSADEILNTTVFAMDYDGSNNIVTLSSLINGKAILFFKFIKPKNKMVYFDSLQALKSFDKTRKGYFALDNPAFSNFYIGRYIKDKNIIEYQPLKYSGIAGVKLNYDGNRIKSAYAILNDNSQRLINTLKINNSMILKAHFKPSPSMRLKLLSPSP